MAVALTLALAADLSRLVSRLAAEALPSVDAATDADFFSRLASLDAVALPARLSALPAELVARMDLLAAFFLRFAAVRVPARGDALEDFFAVFFGFAAVRFDVVDFDLPAALVFAEDFLALAEPCLLVFFDLPATFFGAFLLDFFANG